MAIWSFYAYTNDGKKHFFKVKASSKPAAIDKAFTRLRKTAGGDVNTWECSLVRVL